MRKPGVDAINAYMYRQWCFDTVQVLVHKNMVSVDVLDSFTVASTVLNGTTLNTVSLNIFTQFSPTCGVKNRKLTS